MTANLYLDIHVLQTVPPSNLNRDDSGTPKQAIFGGIRRARVSSQAWKRATRKYFSETALSSEQATRTQRVTSLLTRSLVAKTGLSPEQAGRVATALLAPLHISVKKKKDGTFDVEGDSAYLLFFGREQLESIANKAAAQLPDHGVEDLSDDEIEEAVKSVRAQEELMTGHPLDVALFGRMVADLSEINVDAAVQVAHAISTHAVEFEADYYTAVDDEKSRSEGDDMGAGMIGYVEYNSATLYRYATLGVHQLTANLGSDLTATVDGARRFLEGFVRSMPTGHQTSFAHRTLPEAVVVVARSDQPVNLVSAFEEPVKAAQAVGGYAVPSLDALAKEYLAINAQWGRNPRVLASLYPPSAAERNKMGDNLEAAFGPSRSFDEVLATTAEAVAAHLAGPNQ
jgi:CRISPR system Cascade subunit CasC